MSDKFGEFINPKISRLIQVNNQYLIQQRAVNLRDEVLQILTVPPELEGGERRKESPGCERWGHLITAGGSRQETNDKAFKPGQCGQAHNQRLG